MRYLVIVSIILTIWLANKADASGSNKQCSLLYAGDVVSPIRDEFHKKCICLVVFQSLVANNTCDNIYLVEDCMCGGKSFHDLDTTYTRKELELRTAKK